MYSECLTIHWRALIHLPKHLENGDDSPPEQDDDDDEEERKAEEER